MEINSKTILPHYSSFNIYRVNENYFIINPSVNFWFKLSKEHLLTLKLLDGKSTLNELLDKVNSLFPKYLRGTCTQFIKDIASNYPFECIDMSKPTELSMLYLVLTNKCNSSCLYCFRDSRKTSFTSMDKHLIKGTILSFKNIAVKNPNLVYTGGEPSCFLDLIEIAEFAKKNNIRNLLQTNGLLININNASLYADIFDKIQISLDSMDEKVNDLLRGKKGHFKTVSRVISLLRKHKAKIRLAATITKQNSQDITRIKKEFPDIEFQYTPMLRIGRGRKMSHLSFSPDEFLELLTNMPNGTDACVFNIPGFGRKNKLCGAGTAILSISPEGDVFPCQMLHHKSLKCGNIKDSSLEKIYISSDVINNFRELTVDKIKDCKKCDIRYICAGGCIANGFWINNNLSNKDYFCKFNKEIIFYNLINQFKETAI